MDQWTDKVTEISVRARPKSGLNLGAAAGKHAHEFVERRFTLKKKHVKLNLNGVMTNNERNHS